MAEQGSSRRTFLCSGGTYLSFSILWYLWTSGLRRDCAVLQENLQPVTEQHSSWYS